MKDEVKISYLEANYEDETDRFTYGGAIQYTFQDYDHAECSTIYGVAASFGVKKVGLTTMIAYNKVNGSAADNFFGGGPFFTNAEHNPLREEGPDGETILYTISWDASIVGAEGLNFISNIDPIQASNTVQENMILGWDMSIVMQSIFQPSILTFRM